MNPEAADANLSLPERLRLGTRDLHAQTERTGAMADLLAGRLSRAGYCAMLRNLHAIYAALEAGLQCQPATAAVRHLQAGPMHREAALAADLVALQGPQWRTEIPLLPAAAAYAARLQALADAASSVQSTAQSSEQSATQSVALVAHVYVRYLGDLHGGQILKRLVARSLHLAGSSGTQFYDFGDEAQVLALRQGLRTALGSLVLSSADKDTVVTEARWAFLQHQQLFTELAALASTQLPASI